MRLIIFTLFFLVSVSSARALHCSTLPQKQLDEALQLIEAKSIYVDASHHVPKERLCNRLATYSPEDVLRTFLSRLDPYAHYLEKRVFEAYRESLENRYGGVGILLVQHKRGAPIFCIPLSAEAKRAGIGMDDRLLSVNGTPVRGVNFYMVSSWIRGKTGTKVVLEVTDSTGKRKKVLLKRTMQHFHTVEKTEIQGFEAIKIKMFGTQTAQELYEVLKAFPRELPIVIDLRGNGGGDFKEAIAGADLFLPKGTFVAALQKRQAKETFYAQSGDRFPGRRVVLLQDRHTASAAEVFIAALTQNGRAESVGKRSYGKGVAQRFYTLSNGDVILLTYAGIVTPEGIDYDGIGLLPSSGFTLKELLLDEIE